MGPADGVSLGSAMVDQDQPALARLTGYISDPEIVQ
jgi:general secretion pathway protein I